MYCTLCNVASKGFSALLASVALWHIQDLCAHHAWRDPNLKVLEKDLYQACLFTQWSAKMLVPEIIEGKIWHNFKYLR